MKKRENRKRERKKKKRDLKTILIFRFKALEKDEKGACITEDQICCRNFVCHENNEGQHNL